MAKNTQKRKNGNSSSKQGSHTIKRGEPTSAIDKRDAQLLGTPFTFMRRFSEEMDRLFEDFGLGRGLLAPGFEQGLDRLENITSGAWAPQVEVLERGNDLIIRTDLPGMTKDEIQVDLDDNSLVIRGERKNEREEDDEGYYRSERSYGSFYRRIPLPAGVDAEEARADFTNGVLEIQVPVPKRSGERRRQLDIGEGKLKAKSAGQRG